jgi:surfeit locus 1 family protein
VNRVARNHGRVSTRRIALALVFGAIGIAILCSLGAWQVRRLHWKEGLLAAIHHRMAMPPETMAAMELRFAQKGDVDYTPLAMKDGRYVFVNRGFVPYDLKDPAKRPDGELKRVVTVTGLARNPLQTKPSSFVPDNDLAANIFYWKDIGAMASRAGIAGKNLVPFFVDADNTPNPGGYPVGGVTIVKLPNNHLQYAITWYGLAAALTLVLAVWLFRQYSSSPTDAAMT